MICLVRKLTGLLPGHPDAWRHWSPSPIIFSAIHPEEAGDALPGMTAALQSSVCPEACSVRGVRVAVLPCLARRCAPRDQ